MEYGILHVGHVILRTSRYTSFQTDYWDPKSYEGFERALKTMLLMMWNMAHGTPTGNHGLFHQYNVEAVTLQSVRIKNSRRYFSFSQMSRYWFYVIIGYILWLCINIFAPLSWHFHGYSRYRSVTIMTCLQVAMYLILSLQTLQTVNLILSLQTLQVCLILLLQTLQPVCFTLSLQTLQPVCLILSLQTLQPMYLIWSLHTLQTAYLIWQCVTSDMPCVCVTVWLRGSSAASTTSWNASISPSSSTCCQPPTATSPLASTCLPSPSSHCRFSSRYPSKLGYLITGYFS